MYRQCVIECCISPLVFVAVFACLLARLADGWFEQQIGQEKGRRRGEGSSFGTVWYGLVGFGRVWWGAGRNVGVGVRQLVMRPVTG